MELQHFSHSHPLVFTDEVRKEEGGDEVECYGCKKSLSGSAYNCEKCNYFLHKECAELPLTLDYPMHEEHPLTLYPGSPYNNGSATCNVCRANDRTRFTYHCEICDFDVDILCVLEKGTIDHKGHHHTLTLLVKEASFNCNVCGTEGREQSYLCMKCQFWIHRSCALSPTTMMHADHDHPLVIGYSLPYEFRSFEFTCDICREMVHKAHWLYYCNICRYFLHMKCAISGRKRIDEDKIIADDPDIIQFPLSTEALRNLLSQTLNKVSLADNGIKSKIDHFTHNHSLVLFDEQSASTTTYEDVVCDGCIQPISLSPYYGCTECGYFLHISCSQLPNTVESPCHPEHVLTLYGPMSFAHSLNCCACCKRGNGFYYRCKTCYKYFDIGCAFFPKIIKHECHKHPMQIKKGGVDIFRCDANNKYYKNTSALACEACDYNILIPYAELPPTVEHDWEEQPLILSYPPYSDHPYRLYCEICEEEMFPKNWTYRSRDGRLFFHAECVIPDADEYSKTKFGQTLKIENHPHPLTHVRKSKNKFSSLCDSCGEDFKGKPVIECAPCKFLYCTKCCAEIIDSIRRSNSESESESESDSESDYDISNLFQ